ncbi:MAG TPA: hypothetical protein VF631_11930 [Allosphingosinicella sp.]|jgi:hypothetical protein
MKILVATAAVALLTLSACGAPQGDDDDESRTEQGDRNDDEDD